MDRMDTTSQRCASRMTPVSRTCWWGSSFRRDRTVQVVLLSNVPGPSVCGVRQMRRFAGNCYPSVSKKTIEEGVSYDGGCSLRRFDDPVSYIRLANTAPRRLLHTPLQHPPAYTRKIPNCDDPCRTRSRCLRCGPIEARLCLAPSRIQRIKVDNFARAGDIFICTCIELAESKDCMR